MISGYNGQPSASTEVVSLVLFLPTLVNDSVWATKSVTSGVADAYHDQVRLCQAHTQGVRAVSAYFPGIHFTINGVSVFTPFFRDDHEEDASIGPKWLVSFSSHVIAKDYEIDYNLNVKTDLSLKTT